MAVMVIRLSAYAAVALVVTQRSVSQIELSGYQATHRTIIQTCDHVGLFFGRLGELNSTPTITAIIKPYLDPPLI